MSQNTLGNLKSNKLKEKMINPTQKKHNKTTKNPTQTNTNTLKTK